MRYGYRRAAAHVFFASSRVDIAPTFSLRVTRLFVRGRPTLPMPFVPDVGHKDPQCRQAQTRAKTANVRHEQLAAKGLPVTILYNHL